jgi:hypothetical protein
MGLEGIAVGDELDDGSKLNEGALVPDGFCADEGG